WFCSVHQTTKKIGRDLRGLLVQPTAQAGHPRPFQSINQNRAGRDLGGKGREGGRRKGRRKRKEEEGREGKEEEGREGKKKRKGKEKKGKEEEGREGKEEEGREGKKKGKGKERRKKEGKGREEGKERRKKEGKGRRKGKERRKKEGKKERKGGRRKRRRKGKEEEGREGGRRKGRNERKEKKKGPAYFILCIFSLMATGCIFRSDLPGFLALGNEPSFSIVEKQGTDDPGPCSCDRRSLMRTKLSRLTRSYDGGERAERFQLAKRNEGSPDLLNTGGPRLTAIMEPPHLCRSGRLNHCRCEVSPAVVKRVWLPPHPVDFARQTVAKAGIAGLAFEFRNHGTTGMMPTVVSVENVVPSLNEPLYVEDHPKRGRKGHKTEPGLFNDCLN
ncbi:Octapeptide-repeat protein T2, partial [Ophiophagus hannah]